MEKTALSSIHMVWGLNPNTPAWEAIYIVHNECTMITLNHVSMSIRSNYQLGLC